MRLLSKLKIPRAAFYLGVASLLTDTASEAIYPLLPLFLTTTLGATVVFVGLFEGVAESVASITKYFSGYYSDRMKKREPFVIGGYLLANGVRPLIGLVTTPFQALGLRSIDRIGKGIRSAPRDAWLASLATKETRGWIFGFHRAMDHAGAVLGPLLATLFLWFCPDRYRLLFLLTLVPGLLAVGAIFLAKKSTQPVSAENSISNKKTFQPVSFRSMPFSFKYYLGVLLLFSLGNSSDAFLLLKLKNVGIADKWIPLLWSGLHVVKMSTSFLGGRISDRMGRKIPILSGWALYAVIYFCLGFITETPIIIGLFLIYGLFYGLTESPEKALIADLINPEHHGAAYGLYNLILGIAALPASLIFGMIWKTFGINYAFNFGAGLSLIACLLLGFLPLTRKGN